MKVQSIYKKRKRVGHMKVQVFKKKREREREKDSPCPKKEREREIVHERSPHTIHTTTFKHMHILIKVYDLFLLQIRFFYLATYEEQVCLQLSPYHELHIKAFLEVGEKDGNNLPW
jgi:hypothetical protein